MKLEDQPIQTDLFARGYNAFGQNPLTFSGDEVNAKTQTMGESGIPSNFIQDGDIIRRLNLIEGWLQSGNFVSGSLGWQIKDDGSVEFNDGYFRGNITGASGSFSGALSAATGTLGAITITTGGNIKFGKTAYTDDTNAGFWLGDVSGTAKLNIGSSATKYFHYDGTDVTILGGTITGGIVQTATSGYRIKLNGSNGTIDLLSDDTVKGQILLDGSNSVIIDTDDNIYFRSGITQLMTLNDGNINLPSSKYINFSGGTTITDEGSNMSIDRALKVHGNVYPDDNNSRTCGASDKKWSGGWFEDINVDDLTCNDSFGGCGSISGCAYIEVNLLEEEKIKQRKIDLNTGKKDVNYTGFGLGDVLCYSSKGLKKSEYDCSMCVTAVSDKYGNPIVIGAEPIKVVGKVAINQFLVTSSTEGVARAWDNKNGEPPRGCVIGQSMEFKEDNKEGLVRAMIRKF